MMIGLDSAEPSLVLDRWRGELPTLAGLIERGTSGRLTSVIPPITVPAWSCMMASRTPGDLGIYGFRNRRDRSYDGLFIANGSAVHEPRLWDVVGRHGMRSIVMGVPGTYPPRPLNGLMVGCFLTPSTQRQYTYPPLLRREIESVVGEYILDCTGYRTDQKDELLRQVYAMTDQRFDVAEHLLRTKPWELFALVEMGPDRMHHGFWKYMDPEHRGHEADSAYENAILDYHRHLDGRLERLLEYADEDTAVLIVSDHGAKRLDGGIRINEWLRSKGLLATLREPVAGMSLPEVGVDWSRTVAWGEGGYYARIFMNVRGREPEGTVEPEQYERVRADLAQQLAEIPDELGRRIDTKIYRPEDLYPEVNGVAPDLMVHFGDLHWRAVGTFGANGVVHTFDNDTGPDDANHAQEGLLIMSGPGIESGARTDMHLLDVAPTVLHLLGLDVPAAMRGRSLIQSVAARANGSRIAQNRERGRVLS